MAMHALVIEYEMSSAPGARVNLKFSNPFVSQMEKDITVRALLAAIDTTVRAPLAIVIPASTVPLLPDNPGANGKAMN